MSVCCFLHVGVFDDVTVEVYETEEVETESGSESTQHPAHHTTLRFVTDNDNDKRLGLTAKADQPDHKKYSTLTIKIDNEAVQKLHTS